MLLSALVGSPQLRLRVLTGEDALDRPVAGVFTTDLLDPRRYLTGGEIVLTGLMWWRSPEDSRVFVSALAAAGVAALGAGDAMLGSVPPDLVEACRQHGLPLFEVPVDVSFAAITEQVMRAFLRPEGPGPAVARLRLLARADHVGDRDPAGNRGPVGGRDPVDAMGTLFAVADAEYGVAGWVLSATGRLVAGTRSAPDAPLRSVLAGACLTEPGLPVTVTSRRHTVLAFRRRGPAGPAGPAAGRASRASPPVVWPAGSWSSTVITPPGMTGGKQSRPSLPGWPPGTGPATRTASGPAARQPTGCSGGCWSGGPVPPGPANGRSQRRKSPRRW